MILIQLLYNLQHVLCETDTHTELIFALDKVHVPLSMFRDEDDEYLPFPKIFIGQRIPRNSEHDGNVHYSDISKYELCSIDRRAAVNKPNLFFRWKKLQTKQVLDKVILAIHRCKTKGKKHQSKGYIGWIQRGNN